MHHARIHAVSFTHGIERVIGGYARELGGWEPRGESEPYGQRASGRLAGLGGQRGMCLQRVAYLLSMLLRSSPAAVP